MSRAVSILRLVSVSSMDLLYAANWFNGT